MGQGNLRVSSVPPPSLTSEQCESVILHMITEDILKEEFHFTAYSTVSYVVGGPKASAVQSGSRRVYFRIPGTVQLNRATCIRGDTASSAKPVRPVVSMRKAPVVTQKAVIQYGDEEERSRPIRRMNSKPTSSSLAMAFRNRVITPRTVGSSEGHTSVHDGHDLTSEITSSTANHLLQSEASQQNSQTADGGVSAVCDDERPSGTGGPSAKRRKPVLIDLEDDDNDDMSLFDNL